MNPVPIKVIYVSILFILIYFSAFYNYIIYELYLHCYNEFSSSIVISPSMLGVSPNLLLHQVSNFISYQLPCALPW